MKHAYSDVSQAQETWRRVKAIAREAWGLPADARTDYVTSASGGDEALRDDVLSLLDSMDRAEECFEVPALASAEYATRRALDTGPLAEVGSRLGSWRIVRKLGHGGMGTVYLAERAEADFTQHGAIKVVRGFADEELLRRFRDERRILAGLEHPYITRLLDGGATASHLPFVVMEYVEGTPVVEYCNGRQLGPRDRLELFRKVCVAVHYAHQRLVIHRDIKESNILVTADGTPKLLDFGIAKLVEPDGVSSATLLRAHSLDSASPEQLLGQPITIATDIYSLGILLYRLLTDCSPYGAAASETALMQAICESVPAPPSSMARTAAGLERRRIGRDLDLIVLKALRKEPERRYSSVEAFSDDLGRYLEGRPVLAAPDSWSYRVGKTVRRHRALTVTAAVALASIVAGSGLAAYQAHVAREQRLRAEQRFTDVRRLANSFLFEFHDAIADLPGTLRARQLVVKRAAEYLDGLARESQGDVTLQRELATAYERLATILGGGGVSNLGDLAGAERGYLTALSMREKLAAQKDAAAEDQDALAQLRVQLARFFVQQGDATRAEHEAEAAVTLLQSPKAAGSRADRLGILATAFHQLSYVQALRGENAAALTSAMQAVDYARQGLAAHPGDPADISRLARIEIDGARPLAGAGRGAEALTMVGDARHNLERVLADEPRNVRYRENLVEALDVEGTISGALGDRAGSVREFSEATAIVDSLKAEGPDDQVIRIAAMISDHGYGSALLDAGDIEAGIARLRRASLEANAIARDSPSNWVVQSEIVVITLDLGEALIARNAHDPEGCRTLAAGLSLVDRLEARPGSHGESERYRPHFEAIRTASCKSSPRAISLSR